MPTVEKLAAVKPFLTGVREILHLQVFIEVDELPATWMGEDRVRVRRALERRGPATARRLGAESKPARRLLAGVMPIRDSLFE